VTDESPPAKILIVEDEALIAREIQHRLTNMGWEVVGMAFGEEAVELARETKPDLLLSDINLRRGLSGIDLAEQIQAEMDIPVVFLTAYSDEDTVAKAKKVTPYGYIVKPVENRDLQITIDMALYKSRVEKELREKQQLLETALSCIGSALIFLDEQGRLLNTNEDAAALLGDQPSPGSGWQSVVGEVRSISPLVEDALQDKEIVKLPPFLLQRAGSASRLVDGIVGPMDTGVVLILRDLGEIEDPVRLEPSERFAQLGADQLTPTESAFCQLLIAPDDTGGDLGGTLDAARAELDGLLRSTDLASVLGQSMVSISMPYTPVEEGEKIAKALLDQLQDFSHRGQAIAFSAGMAFSVGGEQEPIDLFRRAASALDTARRAGGNQFRLDGGTQDIEPLDIQSGHNYRHVILLWNVMNTLSNASDLAAMSEEFCRHVFQIFQPERVALLSSEDQRLNLETAFVRQKGKTPHISDLNLSEREFAMINGAVQGNLKEQLLEQSAFFRIADNWALMISGSEWQDDDIAFLETLCAYFTSSFARFAVPAPEEAAVQGDSTLIHDSAEMQQVLETADLAAPTDATVLLMGESGTGKEMVARYIHSHSPRSDHPLIVVDCGAVAPSLIESELFGHVKGAFTGATSNFKGRLKEAHEGTVLLDEVGELPIDTQVKLLRFVQERQVAAVGSNQYETVDARVIAATNKDLKDMVDAGTFREDLYYRLNVFSVLVPPLRDRPGDVISIARHYLSIFAARYNKRITGFTSEAEQALVTYDWPGNVRELSNVINRSVIMSKDGLISPIQLGVFNDRQQADPEPVQPTPTGLSVLQQVVDSQASAARPIPVGRYLEEDFILMSVNRHEGVLNRAALTIGMPESTLRRKLQKIESTYGSADPERPDSWPITQQLYDDVLRLAGESGQTPLDMLSGSLVTEIEKRQLSRTVSAQLMGVSVPTYRRLLDEIAKTY
jgi:DNA-binding NtrC family response regulator